MKKSIRTHFIGKLSYRKTLDFRCATDLEAFCYSPCIALADCRHKNLLDFLLIRAYFNRGRNELIWLLCGKCNESRSKSQQVYEKIIYLNL